MSISQQTGPVSTKLLTSQADWDSIQGKIDPKNKLEIVYNTIEIFRSLGATSALIEDNYLDIDFSSDFSNFYSKIFKIHQKSCKRIHFFSENICPLLKSIDAEVVAEGLQKHSDNGHYLGYIVVRPIMHAPIAKVIISSPKSPHNCKSLVQVKANYEAHVLGAQLRVSGMPVTQQDSRVGACAQASIWIAGRHFHTKHRGPRVSTVDITAAASQPADVTLAQSLPAGSAFLDPNNMVRALRAMGREPLIIGAQLVPNPPHPPSLVWGRDIVPKQVIARYTGSGIPVILGSVDIHRVAKTMPPRWIIAAKLVSVLS
jgi:hypothetical protein